MATELGAELSNCLTSNGKIDLSKVSEETRKKLKAKGLLPSKDENIKMTEALARELGKELSSCLTSEGEIAVSKISSDMKRKLR